MVENIKIKEIYDPFIDFNEIPMDAFIKIFREGSKKFKKLNKSLDILIILKKFTSIMKFNAEKIVQYTNDIVGLNDVLQYLMLLREKDFLLEQLEITRIKANSNNITAKSDLLNKLNVSLEQSLKQIRYLKEDYFKIKNQRDQISITIDDYNNEIINLNKVKKESFNQINKITRGMESTDQNFEKIDDKSLSKSERIKLLQKQAKEAQFSINTIKIKINETKIKFDEINPKFSKLDADYQKLNETLKNDEIKIKNLKDELKIEIEGSQEKSSRKFDLSNLKIFKSAPEIESDIKNINSEIERISKDVHLLNIEKPNDLTKLKDELMNLSKITTKEREKLIIPDDKENILESIENFRILEILINDLESYLNKFLSEVNLESKFHLIINKNNTNFSIKIQFTRSIKEIVNFEALTTPEKVFFITTLHISIQILLNLKNIVFSNLFIQNKYNKRGSIFRTIRKIIPIFENYDKLSEHSLVFIISNLEMKDQIENLKVINIKENGEKKIGK